MAAIPSRRILPLVRTGLHSAKALQQLQNKSLQPLRLATTVAPKSTAPSTTTKTSTTTYAAKPVFKTVASSSAPARASTYSSTSTTSKEPPPSTTRNEAATSQSVPYSLTDGLSDSPPTLDPNDRQIDWTRTYHGLAATPFSAEARNILMAAIDENDIEVKPDGIIYLPEIKYRRILNRAFGPGSWGLVPRGETIVTERLVTREYALVVEGRLVSIARGEQQYFDVDGIPTATEGCKSNALMRCCKDIGIASELWDPRFIRKFVASNVKEVWVEHVVNKKRRKVSIRKDDAVRYPYKEVAGVK